MNNRDSMKSRRFFFVLFRGSIEDITLLETNSFYLKIDGWKTILSFWGVLALGSVVMKGDLAEEF